MKVLVSLNLLVLCLLPGAFAQYAWFKQFSGNGYVVGTNLSISKDDAIYTIANFNDGASVFGNSFSGRGSLIVKVTKHGDLIWVHQVIYSGNDGLSKMSSDGAGNIYITGTCNNNVTIEGQSIPGVIGTSYVAKLNSEGQVQWVQRVPVQTIFDIDANKHGDLVLIGRLAGNITLGENSLSCGGCSFGAVLSTTGTYRWAKTFGNQSFPISATIDDNGGSYFNGTFWTNFSLDGKNAVAMGPYTFFYAKMNNLGNCSWLTSVKQEVPSDWGPGGTTVESGAMKADGNGNLFAGGHYSMSAEFGDHELRGSSTNENATSLYIAKFDSNGNVGWAVGRVNNSTGNSIDNVLNKNNTVFVTGQDGLQIFIYEYSIDGDFNREMVLPLRGDYAGGFGIDSEDSLYVSGRINDYVVTNKTTAFVLKLGTSKIPSAANTVNAPLTNCASDGIEITTDAINHADVYQWEILYKDKTVVIETTNHTLLFVPGTYGIDGECQIRVRGKNGVGEGPFSPYQTIHMDFALSEELQIEKTCDKIVAKSGDSFKWFFNGVPASYPDGQIEISPQEAGEYYIKQVNACGQKESNILTFVKVDSLYIPNIITPNNDAFNEFFVLSGFDEHTSVFIYNRWGSEVFHSTAYTNNWNGDDLPTGVYFYMIKNPCLKDDLRGPLTISR